jgi:hypothetical protein
MNSRSGSKWKIITLFLFLIGNIALADEPKTDTLMLYNGDKITCAVKLLSLGKLQVKTSDLGTLNIKWYKIAQIETKQVLEIILKDRTKIYGTMSKTDSIGYVKIKSGLMIEEVHPIMEIVSINQIAKNFWQGLDGSFSYGLSYAKGTSNLQSNFAANVSYRTNHFLNKLVLNSIISNNSQEVSRKQDATYSLYYYFRKRAFVNLSSGWQQNSELGIDSRFLGALGIGYIAVQSNSNMLKFTLGPVANIEIDDQANKSQALEAIVSTSYDLYLFANPKISIATYVILYPGITDWGRFRSDLNTQISWEIFSNFTFGLSFYFNSDNQPSSTTASKTDWGSTTSIGYTF